MISEIKEKLFYIIRGNYYRILGKNKDLYTKRYTICSTCPLNSKNKKNLTIFESIWNVLGDFCTECGCPLKSKLVEPDSECPKSLWNKN